MKKETKPKKELSPMTKMVYKLTKAIPEGRVMNYGQVGELCKPQISGYICGRILGDVPKDVPWWRVVAKDGSLPVVKRSPDLAKDQREALEDEGVEFDDQGRVKMEEFRMESPKAKKKKSD